LQETDQYMSLSKSLTWMSIAQAVSFILQFGASAIVAHYLTPGEMGVYGVGFAIVSVISIIQQLSLPAFLIREERLTSHVIATAFTVNAVLTVVLCLLVLGASYAGGLLFTEPGVSRILRALAWSPLFGILAFVPSSLLEREGRFRPIAVISIITGLVTAGVSIAGALTGQSYMSLAYGQISGVAVNCLLMMLSGREHFHLRPSLTEWRRIATFSGQMFFVSGLATGAQRLSEISLGKIVNLAALGLYNRASGMNNMLWANVYYVVSRVLLVEIADLHRTRTSLRETYLNSIGALMAIMWPAFVGLIILAKPVIVYVYGAQWMPAVPAFVVLGLASILMVPLTLTGEIFAATGQLGIRTRIELIRAAVSLVTFVAACFISLEAAAATRVLDVMLAWWLYRPHLNVITDTRTRDLLPGLRNGVLLTAFACFPAAAATFFSGYDVLPLPAIGASVGLGIGLWFAGLILLDHPLWRQMRMLKSRAALVR